MKKNYILSGFMLITVILLLMDTVNRFHMKKLPHSFSFQESGEKVVMIPVKGLISAETSTEVLSSLRSVEKDPSIKGIFLLINSPGGTTGTSEEIYNEIIKLRQKGLKVVASIADIGASGGYYIASAADQIVANASSLTGSIGVIISTYNMAKLADRFGVKSINITSGSMKDMLSPFRDMRPDELQYIKTMINEIYHQFVNDVFAGRKAKIKKETLLSIADGRVFTGMDAKNYGLIDELGGFDKAKNIMKQLLKVPQLLLVSMNTNYWQQIAQQLRLSSSIQENLTLENVLQSFLKTHVNVPLYLSPVGGIQ